jgi:phosphoribosylglycinamide formyltransferase-1
MPEKAFNLVVLISGNGSNLQAIIDQVKAGTLEARICAVISNRNDAFGLERARTANIPAITIDHAEFESRESFDEALMQKIDEHRPDLVVLAGFMRILTDKFVNHYLGKLINIHPSLLPKYQGLDTHRRVLDAGDSEHGASVHYVTPELDSGPVILQAAVPVFENDKPEQLKQRVHEIEHQLYPEAIRRIISGEVMLQGQTVLYQQRPITKEETQLALDVQH